VKFIATDVTDSPAKLAEMVTEQLKKPGFAIDPYFYRSHVTYQSELEQVIYKSWIYAGHVSQIPNKGDYFLFEIGEDSVIVSRDGKGSVCALHNICRHRGARVCKEKNGNSKSFVCPYHGWVYDTGGALKLARDMESLEGFSREDYGLKKVRLEVFEGMIFINCDNEAADFRAPLEKMKVQLGAYNLESAKIAESKIYEIDANWKLCLENYLECYHCATSHRSYAKLHTLKELKHKGAGDFQMGPLTFMLNYPDHCVLYRFIARGITKTDMELVWFVNGNAVEGEDYEKEKITWLWNQTSLEDEKIITQNSEGVNSHFFTPGPYHPEHEETCMKFIKWYLKALRRAAS